MSLCRILFGLTLGLVPLSAAAQNKPIWSWHEADAQILDPRFSVKGDELVITRRIVDLDGGQAALTSEATHKRRSANALKNARYAGPEVMILKIGAKTGAGIDWGWSPAFSPDGQHIVYVHPISGERDQYTQIGIRVFNRSNKSTITLAKAIDENELRDPVFTPDGQHVAYALRNVKDSATVFWRAAKDGTTNAILHAPGKSWINFSRYLTGRLVVMTSTPVGNLPGADKAGNANHQLQELWDVGPPIRRVHSWGQVPHDDSPASWGANRYGRDPSLESRFGSNKAGDVLVYDRGWRTAGTMAGGAGAKQDYSGPGTRKDAGLLSEDGRLVARIFPKDTTDKSPQGIEIRNAMTQQLLKTLNISGKIQNIVWSADSRLLAVVASKHGGQTRYGRSDNLIFLHDELLVFRIS